MKIIQSSLNHLDHIPSSGCVEKIQGCSSDELENLILKKKAEKS